MSAPAWQTEQPWHQDARAGLDSWTLSALGDLAQAMDTLTGGATPDVLVRLQSAALAVLNAFGDARPRDARPRVERGSGGAAT